MNKKQFLTGLLLRSIPFVLVVIATIVFKVCNVFEAEWWGWYIMYVLIFATLAYVVFFAAKNVRGLLIDGVKKGFTKKIAQQFLNEWDKPTYNKNNIIGYVFQNEHDFDRTILFGENNLTITQVMRDEEGMVTGENISEEYAYNQIAKLQVADINAEGSVHLLVIFKNDRQEYVYFDVELAKFLQEKSNVQIDYIEDLRRYYTSLVNEK